MIGNLKINPNYSKSEIFFTEKVVELTYSKTLDSYRARLNNPRSILLELEQVLLDFHNKKIKHFDKTIKPICQEALRFLKGGHYLKFGIINPIYFQELLEKAEDKNYMELSQALKMVIGENKNYGLELFDLIESEITTKYDAEFQIYEFEELNRLIDFLITELVNFGISKGYIFKAVSKCFSERMMLPFKKAIGNLRSLITRDPERFSVFFNVIKLTTPENRIDIKSEHEISDERISEISTINKKATDFFKRRDIRNYYIEIIRNGKDYLSVIEDAKRVLFNLIDIINLGYPDNQFSYSKRCLVSGTNKPELTNTQPINFIQDGSYQNSEYHYLRFIYQIKNIGNNPKIQKETKQKLISAYRYLRLGRDADELEQKFINYWIGIEYLFSNYDIAESTISRLKESLTNAHSVSYIKRNLHEFHKDIKRLKLHKTIPDYSDTLLYLTKQETYEFIVSKYFEVHPLLAFRAYRFKQILFDSKKLRDEMKKHRENLEWHLVRCYRLRNEIVHDAAIHMNIEAITANLRYYLTFILNSVLGFLVDTPIDHNLDGFISIDDYFVLQKLKFKSLEKSDFRIDLLISERSPTELFVF
jgi:hypothetical protein